MPDETRYNIQKHPLLKAEALCAELMENGVSFDELVIRHAGAFRKSYRNDVEQVSEARDGSGQLIIEVNRDGFYDKLPEGLFHQTRGGSNTSGLNAMLGEHRRFREEERQARRFFQPLEQECFRYAVAAEQEERKLRSGMLNGNLHRDFYRFWNIDPALPAKPASILVLVMPWIRQIKGDMQLTAKALSMALAKPVEVALLLPEELSCQYRGFALDGAARLSMDTVCGDHLAEPYIQWHFTICGLEQHEPEQYIPGNGYGRFLQRFEELFIPLDVEARFDYQGNTAEAGAAPVLGYGFYL